MAMTTLNLRLSPWRMLPLREAAEYVGLAIKRFPADCAVRPVEMPGGAKLWDIRDLDVWLDALKGGDRGGDDDIIGRLD